MRVFVSCTTNDLGAFRDALCDKPAAWWGKVGKVPAFASMLDAKAESIAPIDWSIREASHADVLVLLLGDHHGALADPPDERDCGIPIARLQAVAAGIGGWSEVPVPERFSYTQFEVLAALSAKVPILIFTPDRASNDQDLLAARQCTEESWLEDRQARFAQWIRSRFTEDHFRNRHDLIYKVRTAIQRLQGAQQKGRRLWIVIAIILASLLGCWLAREWRISRIHGQQVKQQADVQKEKRLRENYGVALGASLAMIGHSSMGAGRPIFETALSGLGLPASQVSELAEEFNRIDAQAMDERVSPVGFAKNVESLKDRAVARVSVLRRAPDAHIDFGWEGTELIMLLGSWNRFADPGVAHAMVRECADRFQASCDRVGLDMGLRQRLVALMREMNSKDGRQALICAVGECLKIYDMEPPVRSQGKERE